MSLDDDHLFYNRKRWHDVRQIVLLRDNWHCVICNTKVRGKREAVVDHKLPRSIRPDLALDLDNLRTLCVVCHNQSHAEKQGGNSTGERVERFRPKGCDLDGWPAEVSR